MAFSCSPNQISLAPVMSSFFELRRWSLKNTLGRGFVLRNASAPCTLHAALTAGAARDVVKATLGAGFAARAPVGVRRSARGERARSSTRAAADGEGSPRISLIQGGQVVIRPRALSREALEQLRRKRRAAPRRNHTAIESMSKDTHWQAFSSPGEINIYDDTRAHLYWPAPPPPLVLPSR